MRVGKFLQAGLLLGVGAVWSSTDLAASDTKAPAAAPAPSISMSAAPAPQPAWPKLIPAKSDGKAAVNQPMWAPSEIQMGQARCAVILKGLDVVATPVVPFREGDCGAPAAMELISVGSNPQVSFSPPVTVSCDMIASMHQWIKDDLQPLAKRHLGGPLVRIETMSSYSCRAAYGRAKNKLSEHGRANAIDIKAFISSNGQGTDVLADWGTTQREITATRIAAEKAAAERALAAAKVSDQNKKFAGPGGAPAGPAQPPAASSAADSASATTALGLRAPSGQGTAAIDLPRSTITGGADRPASPGVAIRLPGGGSEGGASIGLSFPGMSRLGGPKAAKATAPEAATLSPAMYRTEFLRGAHASACRIFGTTLGPETNEAHKNHFHVDMAERRANKYCE